MKKPFIIHIQSKIPELESTFIQSFQELCSRENLNCKSIHFPSEGPLGHQLKITATDRIQYHPYPLEALILIDKMDFFLNPLTGVSVNPGNNIDILLIMETEQNKRDKIDLNWLEEIQKILPQPDQEFKLNLPHENEAANPKVTIERIHIRDNENKLLSEIDIISMLHRIKMEQSSDD